MDTLDANSVVAAAQHLDRILPNPSNVQVTLLSDRSDVQFKFMLPEVVSGAVQPNVLVNSFRGLLGRSHLLITNVNSINTEENTVSYSMSSGKIGSIAYDQLIIANDPITRFIAMDVVVNLSTRDLLPDLSEIDSLPNPIRTGFLNLSNLENVWLASYDEQLRNNPQRRISRQLEQARLAALNAWAKSQGLKTRKLKKTQKSLYRIKVHLNFRDQSGSAGSEKSNDGFNVLFDLLAYKLKSADRYTGKKAFNILAHRNSANTMHFLSQSCS